MAALNGNILDAFFDKNHERLTELSSNPNTDFEITKRKNVANFNNPKKYNVFHYCIYPGGWFEGLADHRLQAMKKGVDTLAQRTDSLKKALNAKSTEGKTPLHLVAASFQASQACQMAQWLIDMGAKRDTTNDRGETPALRTCLKSFL